jgi:type VI secretion system VasD/TssJ family lipoprotein
LSQDIEPVRKTAKRSRTAKLGAWVAVGLLGCGIFGGGQPDPPEFCVELEASSNLNQFSGEPHLVVVHFFPLSNRKAFMSADLSALVTGEHGLQTTGDVWEEEMLPGQVKEMRETLPRDTLFIGLVADFFRQPSRVTIEAECPTLGKPHVVLSASDLQVK